MGLRIDPVQSFFGNNIGNQIITTQTIRIVESVKNKTKVRMSTNGGLATRLLMVIITCPAAIRMKTLLSKEAVEPDA